MRQVKGSVLVAGAESWITVYMPGYSSGFFVSVSFVVMYTQQLRVLTTNSPLYIARVTGAI